VPSNTTFTFELDNEPRLLVKHQAFPYQEEASDFVVGRDYAAVFHEQGLGKTKIAIDAGLEWLKRQQIDTILIFTKKSLVDNWKAEFKEHSYLQPSILSENSSLNYYVFTSPTRAVLAHYEVAKKEEKRLSMWLKSRRVAVFLDEAVKIKNPDSELTKTFIRLSRLFRKRVILTGTPAANRPFDVWAPVYFLDGGKALGSDFSAFKRATDIPKDLPNRDQIKAAYSKVLAGVQHQLAELSVRETKNGGRISLPRKEFLRIDCHWETTQFDLYRQVQEELRATIMKDGNLLQESEDNVLKRLLRLTQIASYPKLVDDAYAAEPGKFEPLYELITDITSKGEKAIVFTQFNDTCKWLKKQLKPFGTLMLSGTMPMGARTETINWFKKNEEDRVLVATTGAAKEGLTLTVANHVVFYDRGYSLDDYLQSQDRIHRVSQTRTCFVYNMLMADSIDEWIDALIEQKRLAAQLAQGDITDIEYRAKADYSFAEILRGILGS